MITGPLVEMLSRNRKNAETYKPIPSLVPLAAGFRASGKGVVVISCSDPRLDPDAILGLDAGLRATHVRNAGGRAVDAVRTLAALQTVGRPGTIVVLQHTDCGMSHFHDEAIRRDLLAIAPQEREGIEGARFGEIAGEVEESVREDVAILRKHPFIRKETQIVGLKYDVQTGLLTEVQEQ